REGVAELAHVSGPAVGHQAREVIAFDRIAGGQLALEQARHETRDVLRALPERREPAAHDPPAGEPGRPGAPPPRPRPPTPRRPRGPSACRSRFVAATTRTSPFCGTSSPTGRTSPLSSTRRSFGWSSRGSSPSSSRQIVPPFACWKAPVRAATAPEKLPFLWPK